MVVLSAEEVVAGFKNLNPEAKRRVRDEIGSIPDHEVDFDKWFAEFVAISERIRNEVDTDKSMSAIDMLRELRGEM